MKNNEWEKDFKRRFPWDITTDTRRDASIDPKDETKDDMLRIIPYVNRLLSSQKAEIIEMARKELEQVDDSIHALQMENMGNKSYEKCEAEAYKKLFTDLIEKIEKI
jgi:hypothetical protein